MHKAGAKGASRRFSPIRIGDATLKNEREANVRLTARAPDGPSSRRQFGDQRVAMVALDLDAIRINSSARSTTFLELSRERLEVFGRKPKPADDGDALAPAPLRLTADSYDAVRCFAWSALAADAFIDRTQAVRAAPADSR
jgi:hypothetical protein